MTDNEYIDRIVDEEALVSYLTAELGPAPSYEIERHQAGHSNETLFLSWGDADLVLRRPPPGAKADTAHDVLREYRIIDALQETEVRVPTTVLASADEEILGSEFYIMERSKGDVLRDSELDRFANPASRRQIGAELIDRLVEIHAVDYESIGLADFGHPEGYIARQVDRWHKQFEWAFEVTADERAVPEFETIGEWLDDNIPESHPHTLVHGDYKLDNVMLDYSDPPEIVGIFDWELSTLGDPRFDLAWLLTYWRDSDDSGSANPELIPTFTDRNGYPTKKELVSRYEDAIGIEFKHDRFYRTLSVYKLAALCEMFFRRHLEGNADNPIYPKMRKRVPAMSQWAMRIIEGNESI